jgi:hypothetical protein
MMTGTALEPTRDFRSPIAPPEGQDPDSCAITLGLVRVHVSVRGAAQLEPFIVEQHLVFAIEASRQCLCKIVVFGFSKKLNDSVLSMLVHPGSLQPLG